MSWRAGSKIFLEIWPILEANIKDRNERIEFTARLLRLFVSDDMDTYDVEDVHPDIRAAIRVAGFQLAEPDRYAEDPQGRLPVLRSRWLGALFRFVIGRFGR